MYSCGCGRTLLTLSLSSSSRLPFSLLPKLPLYSFRSLSAAAAATATPTDAIEPLKHSILLERIRLRHLKQSPSARPPSPAPAPEIKKRGRVIAKSFGELGLSEEVMAALKEMGITVPTEIQSIGIPAVLEEMRSVVLGSHTGSGKTLAYLLPLVQLLRRDETLYGMLMKPRRPRAVVLCPTRELSEQVFRVAKSISHHARFRATMVSGGTRLRPQEDSLNTPVDMVVGTPGRVLQHIEEGNIVYGDIKYVVLDEADTMFDRGFGPDIRKFLGPLKNRAAKADDGGFQTVLVSATMTNAVQKLVDEEFQGIVHLRTSTLHKKIASARHDFIKLSGSEDKLEALLQVLEPSLSKGNRVMVFCNKLDSSRAVDHFLTENQISTVNYHGEVPAAQRVENLKKFKSDDGDCPTLVCTDLAARGLDLDVDHVVMFDFPTTSIDYLHRTGRTARMGAKGKVTSLVSKKDITLASRIEEAIMKNESLESLSVDSVKRDIARSRITEQKNYKAVKVTNLRNKSKPITVKPLTTRGKVSSTNDTRGKVSSTNGTRGRVSSTNNTRDKVSSGRSTSSTKPGKSYASSKSAPKTETKVSKPFRSPGASNPKSTFSGKKKTGGSKKASVMKTNGSKINVVGFRGRSSLSKGQFRTN